MSNEQGPIDSKSSVVKQQLRLTSPDFVTSFCFFIRFFPFIPIIFFFNFFLLYIKYVCIFVLLTAIFICILLSTLKLAPKT